MKNDPAIIRNGIRFYKVGSLHWAMHPYASVQGDCVVYECRSCFSLVVSFEQHSLECVRRNVIVPVTVANSTINVVTPTIPDHDDDLSWRHGD